MTLKELEKEVLALCFESSIEDNSAFIGATRRALARIATERDLTELFSVYISDEDVTDESHRRYDLKKSDERFLAFLSPPRCDQSSPIQGAFTFGTEIFIPKGYTGYVFIEYKRSPEIISYSTADTELDVAKECEHLVGLLVAAYLLLDGNEALADYYMNLYREGIAEVKLYNRRAYNAEYTDTTGWA